MAEFTFQCPACGKPVKADTLQAGCRAQCPQCRSALVVPALDKGYQYISIGWIAFIVGTALSFTCWSFFSIPFFVASFIMGLLAIGINKKPGYGSALIIASMVMPIIAMVVYPILLAGTVLAGLFSGVAKSETYAKPAPAIAAPAPVPPAPLLEPLLAEPPPICVFLTRMDAYSRAYVKAETTLRRNEISQRAVDKARELLKEYPQMTLTAVIRDVQAASDESVVVSFGVFDLGGFEQVQGRRLQVACINQMKLEMKRTKALAILPGSTFELTGVPVFEPDPAVVRGSPPGDYQMILTLSHGTTPFGMVWLQSPKWKILVKRPAQKPAQPEAGNAGDGE